MYLSLSLQPFLQSDTHSPSLTYLYKDKQKVRVKERLAVGAVRFTRPHGEHTAILLHYTAQG